MKSSSHCPQTSSSPPQEQPLSVSSISFGDNSRTDKPVSIGPHTSSYMWFQKQTLHVLYLGFFVRKFLLSLLKSFKLRENLNEHLYTSYLNMLIFSCSFLLIEVYFFPFEPPKSILLVPWHLSSEYTRIEPLRVRATSCKVKVAQSCPTLCDPMHYTVHGILQARILGRVAFPFSRSSQPRDRTQVSCIAGGFFTSWATREAQEYWSG